jgi:hypothetical protein
VTFERWITTSDAAEYLAVQAPLELRSATTRSTITFILTFVP